VNKHGDEEDAIKIGDGRCGPDDEAPAETHDPVGHVVLTMFNETLVFAFEGSPDDDVRVYGSTSTNHSSGGGCCVCESTSVRAGVKKRFEK
jgi:hypothetical protein